MVSCNCWSQWNRWNPPRFLGGQALDRDAQHGAVGKEGFGVGDDVANAAVGAASEDIETVRCVVD